MNLRRLLALLLALVCASLSGAQAAAVDRSVDLAVGMAASDADHASVRGVLEPSGGAAEPEQLICDLDGDEEDEDSDEDVVASRPLDATVATGTIQIRPLAADDDTPPLFASSLFRPPRL